jgi:aspartyl-tRNA(Asn)/glutamyl-tRNA(Gln) amidotransferase subunit A
MDNDLCGLSAEQLTGGYRTGALSPVEATQAVFSRIEALNTAVNAFVFLDPEGAFAAARASEARWRAGAPIGPADGVPATVKELMPATGWPLRRCSRATPDQVSDEDAPTVARLREAGAVLIGKTNSPEFGWKGTTDNLLFGATGNPWDPSKTAGGSSGGAAAAAALGMGVFHVGTDGGGSIRIPAAFSGVFGLKPTFGRVPVWPLSMFGTTSHAGPMARTVADAASMLDVIAQPDVRDRYALPRDPTLYAAELEKGVAGLKIAFSPTLGFAQVDPEVAAIVADAARRFADLGAQVEEVGPVLDDPTETFRMIWATGAALSVRAYPPEARVVMDPGLVALAEYGESLDHMAYMAADYARGLLGARMRAFHQRWDLLLTPAEPIAAFDIARQVAAPAQRDWIDWTPFTFPFNLTGQPAASVPCGLTAAGLPVGLQVVGRLYEDAMVLRACQAFQTACPMPAPGLLRAINA